SSTTESRSSNRKLKPLPPDPDRHQDSAIARRGMSYSVSVTSSPIFCNVVPPQHGHADGAGETIRSRGGCSGSRQRLQIGGFKLELIKQRATLRGLAEPLVPELAD